MSGLQMIGPVSNRGDKAFGLALFAPPDEEIAKTYRIKVVPPNKALIRSAIGHGPALAVQASCAADAGRRLPGSSAGAAACR